MSGERFDNERQRHERFVGRAELLARLDQLLVDRGTDCWVVVTGGPGKARAPSCRRGSGGARRLAPLVRHHLIRQGAYDWDAPAKLVGSLVAQIDEQLPGACPGGGRAYEPAARLAGALLRVSDDELAWRALRP